MPEGAFKPRPVKPSVDQRPQATQPAGELPVANNDNAFSAEEDAFFKVGEAKNRAAEAELARQAEVDKYNAAQAILKKHEEGKR